MARRLKSRVSRSRRQTVLTQWAQRSMRQAAVFDANPQVGEACVAACDALVRVFRHHEVAFEAVDVQVWLTDKIRGRVKPNPGGAVIRIGF